MAEGRVVAIDSGENHRVVARDSNDKLIIPPEARKSLEKMGEAYVRQLCSTPMRCPGYGLEWLAEIDERNGKRNVLLARIAAWGSIGAVFVGVIGIAVAIYLWDHPRH
jgi:hypothetical protein